MLFLIVLLTICARRRLSKFFVAIYTNVNALLTEWERSDSDDIKDSIEESEKMFAGGVVDVAS